MLIDATPKKLLEWLEANTTHPGEAMRMLVLGLGAFVVSLAERGEDPDEIINFATDDLKDIVRQTLKNRRH